MINHIRTLLLNRVAEPAFTTLGEEFVPTDYLVRIEPNSVRRYRQILFGSDPDRTMMNYRLRQYMQLLHETDLVEFVLETDNRITYSFDDRPFFDPAQYSLSTLQLGSGSGLLTLKGPSAAPDAGGQMRLQWRVTVTGDTSVDITRLGVYPTVTNSETFTLTDGISSHISVPGLPSSNYFMLEHADTNNDWVATLYRKPQAALGTILQAARSVEEPSRIELFGLASKKGNTEPFKTFYNLFVDHHETGYALGGLLLAIANS